MRFNLVGIVIGQRGTGKTSYIKGDPKVSLPGIFKIYPGQGMKILIIDTLDHPAYREFPVLSQKEFSKFTSGIRRVYMEPDDIKMFVDLINRSPHMNNTLIVFEDAGKYTEDRLPRSFKRLIIDSKQRNIDVVFMYHCFIDTPTNIFTKSDFIQLFKTEDSPEVRKKNIRLFDKVNRAYLKVKNDHNKFATAYIDTRTN